MLTRTLSILFVAALALVLTTAGGVHALSTQVVHQNTPQCDPLFIPTNVDEIGNATIFPSDEALTHQDLGLAGPVCTATNLPAIPDARVSIRNDTNRNFTEVWYVADQQTTITNFDGEANDILFAPLQEAFRIDRVGIHRPLLSESIALNGIWEAGETWEFVLQDYGNLLGLPPDAITSRGVGDASIDLVGFVASSGSIIAIVPEPNSLVLVLCGLLGLGIRRRS